MNLNFLIPILFITLSGFSYGDTTVNPHVKLIEEIYPKIYSIKYNNITSERLESRKYLLPKSVTALRVDNVINLQDNKEIIDPFSLSIVEIKPENIDFNNYYKNKKMEDIYSIVESINIPKESIFEIVIKKYEIIYDNIERYIAFGIKLNKEKDLFLIPYIQFQTILRILTTSILDAVEIYKEDIAGTNVDRNKVIGTDTVKSYLPSLNKSSPIRYIRVIPMHIDIRIHLKIFREE